MEALSELLALGGAPHYRKRLGQFVLGLVWIVVVSLVAIALTVAAERMKDPKVGWGAVSSAALASVASGLFGAVTTVVSLEMLRSRRAEREQKKAMLIRLRSADSGAVSGAVEELRSRELLEAGYLDRADLRGAGLRGLDLRGLRAVGACLDGADLRDTMLYGADLRFASMKDVQLSDSTNLRLCNCAGANLDGVDSALLLHCGVRRSS